MPMGMPLKIVHNALLRNETPGIPRDFQKFLRHRRRRRRGARRFRHRRGRGRGPYPVGSLGNLAVKVALASGVAADVWLEDPRALFTAAELLEEAQREMRRRGR